MTENDLATFKRMFEKYTSHVEKNPNSLLARIYSIFTVKLGDAMPVHLILMDNTKKTLRIRDKEVGLKHVFDLKGSMVNREVKEKEGDKTKASTTLKDINLLKKKR